VNQRRKRRSRRRLYLVAAGACVPVAAAAVLLTQTGGAPAAQLGAKPVSYAGGMPMGGYGRGGYPMTGGAQGQRGQGQEAQGVTNSANAAATSTNWSGYAAAGQAGTFTSVSASWSQPTVTCGSQQTFSSFWVGLDGDGTQSVEQTGTEADCDGGAASYQGWFEMFPAAPVFFNQPVKPGDAMSAKVTANGGGAFTLTLSDATQNWTQTTSQTSQTAQLGSAEVIAEAPSSQNGVLPLSNFGAVNFTDADANNAPIGNDNPDSLTMVSAQGVTEATPSTLTGGNAFSVTFGGGGATTGGGSPAPTGSPAPASTAPTTPASTSPSPAPTRRHHHHWSW
jgi:hypothetical protein